MDRIVNWFLLLLISVFDPLAIALILAASTILNKGKVLVNNSKDLGTNESQQNTPIGDMNSSKKETIQLIDQLINEQDIQPIITDPIPVIKKGANKKSVAKKKDKSPEPKLVFEPYDNAEEDRSLHSEQVRNMSHQQVRKYLDKNL